MNDTNNIVIRKRKTSYEEAIVKRFPYTLLIRSWSLMRRAEEHFAEFHEEYCEYASNPVNCAMDYVLFNGIPLTDDEQYLLSIQIEKCIVTGFWINFNAATKTAQKQ